jgi:hypothetical protein
VALAFCPELWYYLCMTLKTVDRLKALTVGQLVDDIYNDHYSHLELIDNMGGDCDCVIHSTLATILDYWEVK